MSVKIGFLAEMRRGQREKQAKPNTNISLVFGIAGLSAKIG